MGAIYGSSSGGSGGGGAIEARVDELELSSDIYRQIKLWSPVGATSAVVAASFEGLPIAKLSDQLAIHAEYTLSANLPNVDGQTIRIKIIRDILDDATFLLMCTSPANGFAGIAISKSSGAATPIFSDIGGLVHFVAPTIVSSNITSKTIEIVATFSLSAVANKWVMRAAHSDAATPAVANAALNGSASIVELDLNYARASLDYVFATMTSDVAIGISSFFTFGNRVSKGIPSNGTTFTLTAGKTYRLEANAAKTSAGGTVGFAFRWFNQTDGVLFGTDGQALPPSASNNNTNTAAAFAVITPATNVNVGLLNTEGDTRTAIGAQTSAFIQQIG